MSPVALPVDPVLPAVADALAGHRAAVLVAAPGAGKTTRVPPALLGAGRVLVLQPRRVAVRAVAARIADERGWTIGREIGWHIRFERRFSPATPLVVVTEGILTARLQQDPLLSDVATVVIDEFHERSIHADLGLALARQAWLARDDLRLLVMSATLDPAPVARFLDDCPVIDVPGLGHPLTVEYAPGEDVATAVRALLPRTSGHVLCFLPGAREIERARQALGAAPGPDLPAEVVPLHGSLDGAAQDAAIRPSDRRRVILATNIAETSLTVPGVTTVVDTGLVKVARYDAGRGIDQLVTERVTLDSADQRAGRAARLGPGLVRRLWDGRDRLRASREPDVARVDLAAPVLDVLAWGADPAAFEWYDPPPAEALEAALRLLRRLGAVADGRAAPSSRTSGGRCSACRCIRGWRGSSSTAAAPRTSPPRAPDGRRPNDAVGAGHHHVRPARPHRSPGSRARARAAGGARSRAAGGRVAGDRAGGRHDAAARHLHRLRRPAGPPPAGQPRPPGAGLGPWRRAGARVGRARGRVPRRARRRGPGARRRERSVGPERESRRSRVGRAHHAQRAPPRRSRHRAGEGRRGGVG
ncbi:MAG: helicase-related protein [Vicinamibacterales bacterium]